MQIQRLTIGTAAAQVVFNDPPISGVKILCREDNTSDVYVGTSSAVTTSTGALLPKGLPATSGYFVIPPEHFAAYGELWVIGGEASQIVDVISQ